MPLRSTKLRLCVILIFPILGLTLNTSCGGRIAEPEIHLIPAGFMGNIHIFHNVPDGEPAKYEGGARVYEMPKDGILRSQTPMNPGWQFTPQYFFCNPRWQT